MAEKTFLNPSRPPIFCPGCSHERVVKVLDNAFVKMGLKGSEICLVSDIGCSGFFDVFFNTHAFHGLHGRALNYAVGIKLCRPELNVVVTMGDGGLGIGGAHVLSACRRNLDLTLLVLNNFNFGMTGGQCSATTPTDAVVASAFLNRLEKPLDLSALATSAGAAFVCRCSAYHSELGDILERAIKFKGFAVVEIQGVCPGRYAKLNKITPRSISETLASQEQVCGKIEANDRPEFGESYRSEAAAQSLPPRPRVIESRFVPPEACRNEVVILGAAGQHVITAGEVLAVAGLTAGLHASQKNEYDVAVLRGPSISEVILSPDVIDYNGSADPTVCVALAEEGVARRRGLFGRLSEDSLVLQASGVVIPNTRARISTIDFRGFGIKRADWALASLAVLAHMGKVLSKEMLIAALEIRFRGAVLDSIKEMLAGLKF